MSLRVVLGLLVGILLTLIFMASRVRATASSGAIVTGQLAFSACFGHPSCPNFLAANSGKKVRIQVRASETGSLSGVGSIIPLEGFPFAIGTCTFEVSGQTDGVAVSLSGVITSCSNIDDFWVGLLPVSISANSTNGDITFVWGPLITGSGEIPGFVHTGTGTVIIR